MTSPRVTLVFTSNEAVCSAVEAGAGAAVVPMLAAVNALATAAVVRIDVPVAPRNYFLVSLQNRTMSNAARSLYEHLLP